MLSHLSPCEAWYFAPHFSFAAFPLSLGVVQYVSTGLDHGLEKLCSYLYQVSLSLGREKHQHPKGGGHGTPLKRKRKKAACSESLKNVSFWKEDTPPHKRVAVLSLFPPSGGAAFLRRWPSSIRVVVPFLSSSFALVLFSPPLHLGGGAPPPP